MKVLKKSIALILVAMMAFTPLIFADEDVGEIKFEEEPVIKDGIEKKMKENPSEVTGPTGDTNGDELEAFLNGEVTEGIEFDVTETVETQKDEGISFEDLNEEETSKIDNLFINESFITLIMVKDGKKKDLNVSLNYTDLKTKLPNRVEKEFRDILIYNKEGTIGLLFRLNTNGGYDIHKIFSSHIIEDLNEIYKKDGVSFERGQGEWTDNQAIVEDVRKGKEIYEKDEAGKLVPARIKLVNNFITVPIRRMCEGAGAKVDWDDNTTTATITKDELTIVVKENEKFVRVIEKEKEVRYSLPVDSFIENRVMYVEPSLFMKLLNGVISYDRETGLMESTIKGGERR